MKPTIVQSRPEHDDYQRVEIDSIPPLISSYVRVAQHSIGPKKSDFRVPSTRWEAVTAISRQLADDYNQLTSDAGHIGHDQAPSLVVHISAFRLSTAMMTQAEFPLPLLGMVHLQHKVWHLADVPLETPIRIVTWAQKLSVHHAGTTVEIWVQILEDGTDKVLWQSLAVYLARNIFPPEAARPTPPQRSPFVAPVQNGQWKLGKDIGRRYAAVSGDKNPIHLTNITAKLFGMPGSIAHGMYLAAKMLTGREQHAPFTWAMEFATPVHLPSTVALNFCQNQDDLTVTGWNQKRGKLHFIGEISDYSN